jgi:hypothetical protein
MCNDAILAWNALPPNKNIFLTPSEEKKVLFEDRASLIRDCLQEYGKSNEKQTVPDDNDPAWASKLSLHAKLILGSWHALLQGPAKEQILDDIWCPEYLTDRMITLCVPRLINPNPSYSEHMMFLINTMLKMYFAAGGMCTNFEADSTSSIFTLPYKVLTRMQSDNHSQLAVALVCKHILIACVYHYNCLTHHGHVLDMLVMLHFQKSNRKLIDTLLSILPHEQYLQLGSREPWQAGLTRMRQSHDEEYVSSLEALIPDLSQPRSLKELSRLAVYNAYQGHNFPHSVQQLHIPESLKYYLTLGVYPVPESRPMDMIVDDRGDA